MGSPSGGTQQPDSQLPPYPEGKDLAERLDNNKLMDILEFGVPNSWQK